MTGVDAVHSSGARRATHPQHASGSHQPRRMYQSGAAAAPLKDKAVPPCGGRGTASSPYWQQRSPRVAVSARGDNIDTPNSGNRRRNRLLLRGGVDHGCSPFSIAAT